MSDELFNNYKPDEISYFGELIIEAATAKGLERISSTTISVLLEVSATTAHRYIVEGVPIAAAPEVIDKLDLDPSKAALALCNDYGLWVREMLLEAEQDISLFSLEMKIGVGKEKPRVGAIMERMKKNSVRTKRKQAKQLEF